MAQQSRLRNLQALWCDSWWDGPLTGIAGYEGREHWFRAIFDDSGDDWTSPRRFELVALTDEEIAAERQIHLVFEEQVKHPLLLPPRKVPALCESRLGPEKGIATFWHREQAAARTNGRPGAGHPACA